MATKKFKKKPQAAATLAEAPDLREAFKEVSAQMVADFKRTAATGHPGGKGSNREAIVRAFLTQYLPQRYGIGTGQLIHWDNLRSRQCDVVIYDRNNTPRLMPDEQHSLFPVEAVFAIVEVKSKLTSAELSDALASLQSAYRVARDPSPWGASGQWTRAERQTGPFCSVFAFSSDRSIDAVREQVIREWKSNAGRVQQPPPLIVILGEGVVGPRRSLSLVEPLNDYTFVRRTKELSLLRFYMHLVGELSQMHLPEFHFDRYFDMPQLLDGRRVRQRLWVHGFSRLPENRSISTTGLKRIVEYCASQTSVPFVTYLRERLRMRNPTAGEGNLERPTFEFNPLGADLGVDPEAVNPEPSSAVLIAVDQTYYVVDLGALGRNDLEARDQTLEDLF